MSGWFMAAAAVVTLVAGAAEANQQRQAGRANQQIAENNATLAKEQEKDAAFAGARESEQAAWRERAIIGSQKAAIAANGLDSGLGTPMDLIGESGLMGGADKSAIELNAARKAWGFGGEALNYKNQGAQARWMGNSSAKITALSSIGSAIGGMKGASFSSAGAGASGYSNTTPSYSGGSYGRMGTGPG